MLTKNQLNITLIFFFNFKIIKQASKILERFKLYMYMRHNKRHIHRWEHVECRSFLLFYANI